MTASNTLRPGWNGLNVTIMVIGFVLFWPLGLAMLAYIIWGDEMKSWKKDVANSWGRTKKDFSEYGVGNFKPSTGTGNVAFDDFRQNELERLAEERRKLDAMVNEFDEYMRDLRMARDREEFERFMNARKEAKAETPSKDLDQSAAQPA